ncbi:hypothetical protein PF011_g8795 [Phytophthora fragariae]|uniref:Uncharacterized protein n=1 Tax=Phytophthora fragariae TaxID=53985 RepID=A0A6A3KZ50_9STRA|nr:hypothetical protein PF011_g8795 [Phytophthora fragariae]
MRNVLAENTGSTGLDVIDEVAKTLIEDTGLAAQALSGPETILPHLLRQAISTGPPLARPSPGPPRSDLQRPSRRRAAPPRSRGPVSSPAALGTPLITFPLATGLFERALRAVGESPDPKQQLKAKEPQTDGREELVESTAESDATVLVGEPLAPFTNREADEPDFTDYLAAGGDDAEEDDLLDDDVVRVVTSPTDLSGLDRERFIADQKRSSWIQAVIAFIEHVLLR